MSDIDTVRLLIPDLDADNPAFTDSQITSLLVLTRDRVFLAAALALEIIAADEALIYKIVTTDDLSVNGVTGASQVLLARAKQLRADQDKADIETSPNEGFQLIFPAQGGAVVPEATAWSCL